MNSTALSKTVNRAILEHRVVEIEYSSLKRGRIDAPRLNRTRSSSINRASTSSRPPRNCPPATNAFAIGSSTASTAQRLWTRWFKPDKNFDLNKYLGESLGVFGGGKPRKFKIRVSAYAAPWVLEDPWHPEQKVEEHKDGSITVDRRGIARIGDYSPRAFPRRRSRTSLARRLPEKNFGNDPTDGRTATRS